MNRLSNCIGSLFFLGIGFLLGQYQVVGGILDTPSTLGKDVSLACNKGPSEDSFVKTAGSTRLYRLADNPNSIARDGMFRQSSTNSMPFQGMVLSAEAQGQLVAQQLEAKQSNINALEEMILSLEESGASAKEIQDFRDIEQAIEEQPVEELQNFETNTPEPSNDELVADLAASLEQAGIPPADLKNMLEAFAQQLESNPEKSASEPPPLATGEK